MKNNYEHSFFAIICLIVLTYIVIVINQPESIDTFSKVLTTCTALISAVAFWLQYKKNSKLTEANYIMNLNQQFISNKDIVRIEAELEYYSINKNSDFNIGEVGSDRRQLFIDYLVYLEAMGAVVKQGTLDSDAIKDIFAYRLFVAANNPIIQKEEIEPFITHYRNMIWLYKQWYYDCKDTGMFIPLDENKDFYIK